MNTFIQSCPVWRGLDEIEYLLKIINGRGFIGGSYAAYMGAIRPNLIPNDIDVFATSIDNAQAIAREIWHLAPETIVWNRNDVAHSLAPIRDDCPMITPVQVVNPHPEWKEFPIDIVNSFDMDICRAVLVDRETILADLNVGSNQGKFLLINNPLRSLKRAMKYHKRGIEFNEWELLKLFRAWQDMPEERRQGLINSYDPALQEEEYAHYEYGWNDDDYFDGE